MNDIVNQLRPYSKAIAGFIAGQISIYLAKHNIIIADDLNDAIEVLIGGIIVMAGVYFAPANKSKEN